jgi:hypothetical protein
MNPAHKMTIEEIQEQCATLSDEQLLLVVNNKRLYTEKIVRVAYQEIRRRRLSKEDLKEFKKAQTRRSKVITGDIHEDLLFFEKVAFFFLFFPGIHRWVLRDYRKKGYLLKVRQAGYYFVCGAGFFFLDLLLGQHRISLLTGAMIWILSFLPAYFFNQLYFRQKTIQRLAARVNNDGPEQPEQNTIPWR